MVLLLLLSFIGSTIYISTIPSEFDFEYNRTINTSIDYVYNQITKIKHDYTSGVSILETYETERNKTLKQHLVFKHRDTATLFWTLTESNGKTNVKWQIKGSNGFITKLLMIPNGGINRIKELNFNNGSSIIDKVILTDFNANQSLSHQFIQEKQINHHFSKFLSYAMKACLKNDGISQFSITGEDNTNMYVHSYN